MGDVHPIGAPPEHAPSTSSGDGNGGNGRDLHGRLSKLEARMDYLATKSDVEQIKTWALKGALGGMVLAATLAIGILKIFG